jgi:cell wall assembly regulator SMI1
LLSVAHARAEQGPPTGAAPEQLASLERQLGYPIPAELVRWLSLCNGYIAGQWGFYGTHPGNNHKKHLDIGYLLVLYPVWQSNRWIPVASDGCGNDYVLDRSDDNRSPEAVFFVDCALDSSELAYVVASSLPRFLTFYLESDLGELEQPWPFDREYVLARDPEIASIDPRLLPWNQD